MHRLLKTTPTCVHVTTTQADVQRTRLHCYIKAMHGDYSLTMLQIPIIKFFKTNYCSYFTDLVHLNIL